MTARSPRLVPSAGILVPGMLLTFLAAIGGLVVTGAAAPHTLVPVPWLVTWGTPVARTLHHTAMLMTVGALWTAVLALPAASRAEGTRLSGSRLALTRIAGASALVWGAASLVLLLLGAAEAVGSTSAPLWHIAMGTDLGRLQLGVAIVALVVALVALPARTTVLGAWGLAFAIIGVGVLGFAGHAGASLDHTNAVNAMIIHLVGMATWGGPLLVMLCFPRLIGDAMPVVVRRFSPWALAAIIALAVSGLVNAAIRLDRLSELVTTGYGALVLLKAIGLAGIAALGWAQRRRLGDALRFRHLALSEGLVLAVVVGASIALGRSAPPVPQSVPAVGDLRLITLVGYLPPKARFDVPALITQWQPDWMGIAIGAAAAVLYAMGVIRLHRRGDRWPLRRTIPFVLGCLALWWVTSGGAAAYGRFRFDAHMVQHMALMMIVPPLWVLGAPVTLMSRALKPRTDGSRGMREWVLAVLHSRYSRVISFPPVAGIIFAGSLVLFYFTPLFELAMRSHAGHLLMIVHFLASGYLFAWVLIGIDPAPRPVNPVLKLVTLLITLSFHAFFGVAVVSATWIIAQGWYDALHLYSPGQLMFFQQRGGSIMWGVSEIPTLAYAIILAFQWTGTDRRQARQYDRKAARDNDAELAAYNAYLAGLAPQGRPGARPSADEGTACAQAGRAGSGSADRPAAEAEPGDRA